MQEVCDKAARGVVNCITGNAPHHHVKKQEQLRLILFTPKLSSMILELSIMSHDFNQ